MAKALPAGDDQAAPKKKSRFKKILFLVSLLLFLGALGGGGFAAYKVFGLTFLDGVFSSSDEEAAADGSGASGGAPAAEGGAASGGQAATAASEGGAAKPGAEPRPKRTAIKPVSLPSLTVNLADPSGTRYLQIGMDVEVNTPEAVGEVESQTARVRDAIILLLSSKRMADLATPEGKILLKTEVAGRLNQILGAQRVVRIYFTEFVIR